MVRFRKFIELWKAQKRYSWCLCYTSDVKNQALAASMKTAGIVDEEQYLFLPGRHSVKGIAVCWELDKVYFIALHSDKPDKQEEITERFVAPEMCIISDTSRLNPLHGFADGSP
jgi:hypothetical protein